MEAYIFRLLFAPFAFKLVNYSSHSDILNFHNFSKATSFSFKNSDFTVFKLCFQKLANLDTKCAKRSVKMWAINFYKSFSKKILLLMNGRWSKIRSLNSYGVSLIPFFATFCKYKIFIGIILIKALRYLQTLTIL